MSLAIILAGQSLVFWAGAAVVFGGVFGALLVVFGVFETSEPEIELDPVAKTWQKPDSREARREARRQSAALQDSLVGLANKGLERSGRRQGLRVKLEHAGSRFRPQEWVTMAAVAALVALIIGYLLIGIIGAILFPILVIVGFNFALKFQTGRRKKAFEDQLLETLQLMSSAMRSGLSLPQALDTVASEAPQPTADEISRVNTETRLGRDMSASLRDMSDRIDSTDFKWIVGAIDIHREVGGDLSQILDRASSTIRARNRVKGQVAALSAEGKLSGIILIGLPPVMFVAMWALNPEYVGLMLTEPLGWAMLAVALVMLTIGGLWIRSLAKFEY